MFDLFAGFVHLFRARPVGQVVIDVFDVLIVTYVIYRALLVLRGTRAMQMGIGLGVIAVIYFLSGKLGLVTLYNLLSMLLSSIILIVVVVFQNDIRRGLMRVGARAFFGGITREQESRVIDEVVAAATELARHRMGALICFEQDANLDEFVVGQGTVVDASVQRELLVSLFVPESVNKLHDGAVVIRNLRVAKAGVFFPMPDTKVLDKSFGSRHRAALGITEETDAVVVVVSEERGTIGFRFNGNIVSNLDGASLRQALLGLFGQKSRTNKKRAPTSKRGTSLPPPRTMSVASIPPPEPSVPAPIREESVGSVIMPVGSRDSVMPPASSVGSRLIPPLAPPPDLSRHIGVDSSLLPPDPSSEPSVAPGTAAPVTKAMRSSADMPADSDGTKEGD